MREKLAQTTDIAPITAELLDSLPHLHAVCNEVLHLSLPAGLTKRVAVRDTTILGRHVPKGMEVMIVMRAINKSRELWGEDAGEFQPERWLQSNNGGAESSFSFMTFLHGECSVPDALAEQR